MFKEIFYSLALTILFVNNTNAQELVPYCKNGIYGYSDLKGKLKIEPQFTKATPFINGAAIVSMRGEHFLIDPKGNKINAKAYDDIRLMTPGVYKATSGDSCGIINKEGTILLPFVYKDIDMDGPGYVIKSQDDKTLFLSMDYKEVIRSDKDISIDGYKKDEVFTLMYTQIINNAETKKSVIINRDGKIIYGPVKGTAYAKHMKPFNCFTLNLQMDSVELYGVIGKNGEIIVPVEFKEVEEIGFSEAMEDRILKLMKTGKDPKAVLSDKTILAKLFVAGYKEDKVTVYNMLGEQIIKPTKGHKVDFFDLETSSLIAIGARSEDREGNTVKEILLFTEKGKAINKKPLNEIEDSGFEMGNNLIIGIMDTLYGVYDADGNEYIPFRYQKIRVEKNGMLYIEDFRDKQKLVVYPNDPKLSDENTWFDEIYQDALIVLNEKNNIKYLGMLDSSGNLVLPVEYTKMKPSSKGVIVTNILGKQFVYSSNGERIELTDDIKPEYILNSGKKQFVLKEPNAYSLYNNGERKTIFSFNDGDNVSILSALQNDKELYLIINKNDSAAIYKISGTKIKQLHPFAQMSYGSDSPFGVSYLGKDTTSDFVTIMGVQAVPFGKWEYINDFNTWGKPFNGKNLIIAKGKQKTISYNEKGKKVYECKNCYTEIGECDWDYDQLTLFCGFDHNPDKNYYMLYDATLNKITSFPITSTGEELNDNVWIIKDTMGLSYLYFKDEKKLKPLKIKHSTFFTFGESEQQYGFSDVNNNWYLLDNKTSTLIKVPGSSSDVEPFYSTYSAEIQHSYFYCNIEQNGERKQGVVNEKGKIIVKPEYESIEMPVEFEDYALFVGKRKELTDIINIKGEIVSPAGKKYGSIYSENESLLTAEIVKGDTVYTDLYNALNNYKRINYTFKNTGSYPNLLQINGKYVVQYSQPLTQMITEEGETYEDMNEYDLYVGEDGTRYFEFDKRFKE